MSGISIEGKKISKQFGDLKVLEGVDFRVEPGEFVAIVGRSGCGKSTLLRLITHLETVTDGEILVDEKPVTEINSDIRFVFQDPRLLMWKSSLRNVLLGSPTRSEEDAKKAMRRVGLEGREKAWPGVLSGGQRQRLSLARALVGQPKALLLDEPLGALDALTRIEMQRLIERLWKEQNFTAILVTHDVSEAVLLADHVIVMDEHKIVKTIKIELARPRTRNSDFAYYEQEILKYIMKSETGKEETDYVI